MCRSTGSPAASPSTTTQIASLRPNSGPRRAAGFTLLEVLIAFAVLAVMLIPILQVFGGGLGLTQTARGYAEGTLLARSKLAEVSGAKDLAEGETSGEFEERGFHWQASVVQDQSVVTLPDNTVVGPASPFRGNDLRHQRNDDDNSDATSDSRSGGSLFDRHRSDTGSGSGSLFGGSSSGSGGSSLFGRSSSSSGSSSLFGRSSSSSGSSSLFGRSSSSSGSSSLFGRSSSSSGSSSLFGRSSSSSSGSSSFGGSSGGSSTSSSHTRSASASGSQSAGVSDTEDASGGLDRTEPLPYRVSVTVAWGNAWSGGGEVTLTTLRLKQPASGSGGAPNEPR